MRSLILYRFVYTMRLVHCLNNEKIGVLTLNYLLKQPYLLLTNQYIYSKVVFSFFDLCGNINKDYTFTIVHSIFVTLY